MKRICIGVIAIALMAAYVALGSAATKTYQFTGMVKTVDGANFSVEKSAKETWSFETSKDTKGAPKVGDKVTVYYKMVATEIESKPAPPAPTKK
jgi:uncharacterized protein YxeA